MSQNDLKIGPKIKAFRRQLGLQANKLAQEINISPSYLNLIEGGKRKIDGDLLLKICEKLNIELSQLTSKDDVNLENTLSEILDDKLFEDLDILGPEVKDLVGTNPKIGKAIVRLGDILKKKDHELVNKIEKISGKIVDNRKNSFPGEVISDFLQENKNYFPKLEDFANKVFPVPGGPTRRTPFGIFAPSLLNFSGDFKNSFISSSSSFASSAPATSLNVTFGDSSSNSFAFDLPNCII